MKLTNDAGHTLLLAVLKQVRKDLTDRVPAIRSQAELFLLYVRSVFSYTNTTPRRPRQIRGRGVTFSRENTKREIAHHEA